ncbi:Hypothetical protein conserved in the Yarrowia clade [Yarrowia lipolytica]|nr:Hypothetical protein conserved in the Yarrowia clade [Yarrowia lipolytica]
MRAVLALAAVATLASADTLTVSTFHSSHDSHGTQNHTSTTVHTSRPVMQTYTVSLDKTTFTTVFNYSALATVVHNNMSQGGDHKKEGKQHNSTMVLVKLPGTNVTGTDPDNDGDVDSWSDDGDEDSGSSRNLKYLWLFFLLLPLALVCIVIFACVRRRRTNERRLRRASLRNQALRLDLGSQNMTEPSQDIWYSAFSFRHRQRNRQPSREQNEDEDRDEPLPLYDGHDSSPSPEMRQSTPPVYDEVVGDSSPDAAHRRESFELPRQSYELSRQMTNPRVSRELRRLSEQRQKPPNQNKHPQRLSKGPSMHSKEVTEEDETDIDYERGSDEDYYIEGDIARQRV